MTKVVRSDSLAMRSRRVVHGIKERAPSVGQLEIGLDQWVANMKRERSKENELVRLDREEVDFETNELEKHYNYNLPNLERFVLD